MHLVQFVHQNCMVGLIEEVYLNMCVVEVGGQDAEIRQGWAFLNLRCRYQAHRLSTALPLKLQDGGCRGSIHVDSDMPVGAVGG